MEFENFLFQLAEVLQFSSLKPDTNGVCSIMIKESQVPLLFEVDEELVPSTILVSTEIISFPLEYRRDIWEAILLGNHAIEETLSIKPNEDMIYLHRRFHPLIGSNDLKNLLDSYIKTVVDWREKITHLLKNPPTPPKALSPPSSINIFPNKA
ncbi:MAG: hypothetical protein S4CHLAM123_08640 [Chlamydiales bacterium]|nr:hypothetical protein [Chlamydiales bacterium]